MPNEKSQVLVDISNLRLYASIFREKKWETDVFCWNVFETTLYEIADRIAALHARLSQPAAERIYGYSCWQSRCENRIAVSSQHEADIAARDAGWVLGHHDGQAHYSCPDCKVSLHGVYGPIQPAAEPPADTIEARLRKPCGICGKSRNRHVGKVFACFGGYGTCWNPDGERDYRVWPQPAAESAEPSDTEMLDWLDRTSTVTESMGQPLEYSTGITWTEHESMRAAIRAAMRKERS